MRIRTFTWLAGLAVVSTAALSAQIAGESQTPTETPVMLEEAAVPEPTEVQATATTEVAVPTPEAGAVQISAESSVSAGAETDSDADSIIIEREGAAADMQADTASQFATDEAELPAELPKTASPLALLGLLGLGSSGTALGVRFARRRK